MAPIKRKAAAEERPAKRNKADDDGLIKRDAAKFLKDKKSSSSSSKPRTTDEDKEKKPVESSLLQDEDRAFPRGGASVLTPLEHKQIKLQAERDVLFEQAGKKKPKNEGDVFSDDDGGAEDAAADSAAPAKKKRKTKNKKNAGPDSGAPKIKVQSLSYKNIAVGTMLLGQVTAITSRDVVLALPNNLTGFVPITAVSERVNQKIESLLAQAENEKEERDDDDDDDDDDDIDLNSLFHIGQYLRATVTSTADDSTSNGLRKNKKRLELSVDPKAANNGLTMADAVLHATIQASVRSVEDHGLVMDLGLDDQDVKGFVSKKELGKAWGEIEKVGEGAVMLCVVTGKSDKVIKLAPDNARIGDINKQYLSEAPTVDAFLPGTAVDLLITENGHGGVAGKIMGMLDATADIVHCGGGGRVDSIAATFKIGSKVKARITCTFHSSEEKKVGVSFLDHIKTLKVLSPATEKKASQLQASAIIGEATVNQVEPSMGLFLTLPQTSNPAFAHISRVSDTKIDALEETTGKYKIGSTHKARILGFNPVDGIYNVSLEPKVIDQPFLSIDDVQVGTLVKGVVEKLILGAKGVTGVLVRLADGIDALVPDMHMSDVRLQHPEKKFREGFPVTGRVLTVDLDKKQIRLTLKKTLVNSEAKIWKSYDQINVGDEAPGTIINLKPNGAVVQFYGRIRAWLPVAEMSEAYISDPSQHFRLGQTVNVHALDVDAEEQDLKVSCKDRSAFGKTEEAAWTEIKEGQIVSVTVTEVTSESVMADLDGSAIKSTIRLHQLSDGSESKARSVLKQIRVGQKLQDLVVLEKFARRHLLILSNKPGLVKAAKAGSLVTKFKDLRAGQEVDGFVRNITPDGIFVEFAAALVGFMPKTQVSLDKLAQPAFGMKKDQSISARVLSVDAQQQRFVLTQREAEKKDETKRPATNEAVINAVDGVSTSIADFTLGKETKARIVSVKETQLNVLLGDNLQGRIDVSECFSNIEDIKNRKRPLQQFKPKQVLSVRVLGIHDARNHRFLPISHRQSKIPVFELTAKSNADLKSDADVLTLDKLEVGSGWIAYVNNIGDNHVWANITPNVRGRIDLLDLSSDVSLLSDINKNFPVGSALKVTVKNVDINNGRLDLTATTGASAPKALSDLTVGQIIAGKVTKVSERALTVQLGESLSGIVTLTEMSDDYTQANPSQHSRNEIVLVCVVAIDAPNKRVFLSVRPSRVLSSSLPVEDREITTIPQLEVNDVVRGFVKAVTDKGVIVNLGPRVDAFVRISDISDQFVKEWKSAVEIDQLVKGKILAVDASLNHVQMSLKTSHVDKNYTPPNSFGDLKMGDIVTAKVRKVEEFGVFLDVDNTQPRVSGLCHRTQIADAKVEDVKKLYEPGDAVKAKVLHIDREKRRISFGLKASYFRNADDSDEEMEDDEESDGGAAVDEDVEAEDSDEEMGGIDLSNVRDAEESGEDDSADESSASDDEEVPKKSASGGLSTSGFDWSGSLGANKDDAASDTEAETAPSKKRKRKAQIVEDRTGDLDAHGPQSVADFERLLLTSPSDSALWIQYMAFQLQLSEVQKAREIGARALRTIHLREQDEKLNVWIALLNLEVAYGDGDRVEEVFKNACSMQDPYTIHARLASIYTQAGKLKEADDVFEKMMNKKDFRAAHPEMWENYAAFLFTNLNAPARARALLPRALQSLPSREHRSVTSRFAALEFKSANGDAERGRTVFEGLLAEWPKWTQGWDQLVDLERSLLTSESATAEKEPADVVAPRIRRLYERMSAQKMKKRRAKFVFKKWLEFEESLEGLSTSTAAGKKSKKASSSTTGAVQSQAERVKALAREYVERQQSSKEGDEDDDDDE
ncbi:hypothetical protein AAFC00_002776 [Neodothiora populina]|uniref:S1 motif domain-containing protein n=1 Tax=Neodothiora populina TaxID=2781224 RepID=A0ABR3P871_9PEZI